MDLNQKRNAVKDIINKCNRMLRETTNAQTDEIKSRLESIKTQADIVCQLSAERLHQLESALPLATHFSENQAEIHSWLDEMEADLKAHSSPGNTLEQVKKQLDNIKVRHLQCSHSLIVTSIRVIHLHCIAIISPHSKTV